jgi:hypothetical protein
MGRSWARLALPLALLLGGLACGPVVSTVTLNSAEVALETARLADAEQYATYEYVSAQQYFAKAQEEWGYSDWQKADAYAQRALDFAQAALTRARSTEHPPTPPEPEDDDN